MPEALADSALTLYVATFGHLYQPDDLEIFLQNHSPDNLGKEFGDPAFAVRVAEVDGKMVGYAKLGPPHLPFEPRGEAAELRQLYVVEEMKGQGVAHSLMEWVIDRARDRRADQSLPVCLHRKPSGRAASTKGTVSSPRGPMPSWWVPTRTRTSS